MTTYIGGKFLKNLFNACHKVPCGQGYLGFAKMYLELLELLLEMLPELLLELLLLLLLFSLPRTW